MAEKGKVQDTRVKQFQLVADAYSGDGGFADGTYLFKFAIEKNFDKRKEMSSFNGMLKPVVSARVSPVFSQTANRTYDENEKSITLFIKDSDNNGTTLHESMREFVTQATLLDQHFVVVDNFLRTEIPRRNKVALEQRKIPYIYQKSVMDVESYELDRFGHLVEITFKCGEIAPTNENSMGYVYKRFSRSQVESYEVRDGEKEKSVTVDTNLGYVPVVFWNKKDFIPFPSYYPSATQSRKIYNIESEINSLSRSQSFSILLIPAINAGAEEKNVMTIGTDNAMFYDPVNGAPPSYISPDFNIMTTSIVYLEKAVDTFIQGADILGSSAVQRGSKSESGVALSFKFFGKQQAIEDSARMAESLETRIIEIFCDYMGIKFKYSVKYNGKFTPTFDEIKLKVETLEGVLELDLSKEVNKEVASEIIRLIGNNCNWSQETVTALEKSITGVVKKTESSNSNED